MPELLINDGLAYLGTPYTDYPDGHDAAAADAARLAGLLSVAGVTLICPIFFGHAIARRLRLDPNDQAFWRALNRPIMARCDRLIVGKLTGWDRSAGLAEEIEFFRRAARPIFFCCPDTLLMQREGTPALDRPSIEPLPDHAHGKTRSEQGGAPC